MAPTTFPPTAARTPRATSEAMRRSDPSADVASDGARDLVADMARDASAGDGARDTTADVASEAGRDGAPISPADLPLDGIGVGPIQTAPTPAGACSPACTAPRPAAAAGWPGSAARRQKRPAASAAPTAGAGRAPCPRATCWRPCGCGRRPTCGPWAGAGPCCASTAPPGSSSPAAPPSICTACGAARRATSGSWVRTADPRLRRQHRATFDSGTTSWLQAIWGTGANDVWIAGWYETTLHWDGSTWTSVPGPGAKPLELLYGVWGSATDDVWVTGGHGHLQHWDGTAWSMVNLGLPNDELHGVTGTGPDDVWIASYDRILHWNGSAWSTSWTSTNGATGPLTKFFGVGASSPSEAWAVGRAETNDSSGPSLFRWDGTRWSPVMDGPQATLYAVAALGAGKALAVGDITELVGTGTPVRIGSGSPGALHSVWGSSTSDVWAVGGYWLYPNSNRLHHWDGQRWTAAPSATARWGANAVWGSGPADVWAGGEGAVEHWDGEPGRRGPSPWAAPWSACGARLPTTSGPAARTRASSTGTVRAGRWRSRRSPTTPTSRTSGAARATTSGSWAEATAPPASTTRPTWPCTSTARAGACTARAARTGCMRSTAPRPTTSGQWATAASSSTGTAPRGKSPSRHDEPALRRARALADRRLGRGRLRAGPALERHHLGHEPGTGRRPHLRSLEPRRRYGRSVRGRQRHDPPPHGTETQYRSVEGETQPYCCRTVSRQAPMVAQASDRHASTWAPTAGVDRK